jgi:hypothetical protein
MFKTWFKNSVVVDDQGNPQIMYRYQRDFVPEFRALAHFGTAGQARHVFQSRTRREPTGEQGSTYPVYLSIQNPKRIEDRTDNSVLSLASQVSPEVYSAYMEDLDAFRKKANDKARKLDAKERKRYPDQYQSAVKAFYDDADREFRNYRDVVAPSKFAPKLIAAMRKEGHDGFVYNNKRESDKPELLVPGSVSMPQDHEKDSYIIMYPWQVKSAIANKGNYSTKSGNIQESLKMTFKTWLFYN